MLLLLLWSLAPLDIVVPAEAPPPLAVPSTQASSERSLDGKRDLARFAFDGDTYPGVYTRWCSADARARGQWLEITLDSAHTIDGVLIQLDPHSAPVARWVVAADGKIVTVTPDAHGLAEATLGVRTRTVRIGVGDADERAGKPVCVLDVTLAQSGFRLKLLHGVPDLAARALAGDAAALDAAMAGCDAKALAERVALPVAYDYVGPTDAGARGQLADAAALAARCRAPGLGRLSGNVHARLATVGDDARASLEASDGRRWILAWRDGRWRLATVVGAGRVRH